MANYPVKLLKDKDGTAFIPVVNSDSIITPEGDTLNDLLEEKQDLLTSGTNIKTINNESLLGSGNISIQGGSGASVWGSITGTLSNQTDLYNELSDKVDKSAGYGDDILGMYVNDSLNGIGLSVSDMEGRKYGSVNINTNGVKISGLITPTSNKDAANKQYVDSVIPTKVSDLTNDSGFVTSTVNNLTNYYTKTDTYTKTEVNNLIGSISSLDIEVVQTLPSSDISTSTIYLLPKSSSEQQNIYDEYIYVNNSWELIGSTAIDLSNYYTSTQVDNLLSNKASKSFYSDTTINVGRKRNTTVGTSSTAEGIDTTASGVASHAEGWDTTASGQSSHAEGENTEASGLWSHAEGEQTTASGESSHAEGEVTEASGGCSHAEGFQTTASGEISHAEGWTTTASGVYSHAEGENTVANSEAQHVFGRYNILDTNDDTTNYGTYVEIVGNGASRDARSNARTLDWSGNETLAGDLTSSGTVKATKGLWSRPTGEVGTATSDSNSCLLIKRASSSEAPNNGVVLEFGNSANWRGQLYIGDNATQGIYYNGWSDGVRGSWIRLADQRSNLTTGGSAIKAGYQIDGKDVYVKRLYFSNIAANNVFSVASGLTVSKIQVIKMEGIALSSSNNYEPLPMGDWDNTTTYNVRLMLFNNDNTLKLYTANANFSKAWVNIYYINK